MFALYKKEISTFLNSIIGYVVMMVFLITVSLFLWVFPSELGGFNILNEGYSSMDGLFLLAPWVFMFLIPAVTMRSFSEEKRTGTLELLLTKPLSEWSIIMAKYLAGVTLVLITLVPTLIFFISVYLLGNPVGNLDIAGISGSYMGLVLLAASFVSIGIFSSSLTQNQVVSFIIAVFLCFVSYIGFQSVASFDLFGTFDTFVMNLGINEHYISISRGVIDTRDVVYFLSFILIFQFATKLKLQAGRW